MNEETTVPSTAAVTEAAEPPATEVPETYPETTDGAVETTIPEESTVPETTQAAPVPSVEPTVDTTVPVILETTSETIWEDFTGAAIEETVAETTEPVHIVDVIQTVGSDLAHINLFGFFLICGTLIGLALLRDRHGN